MHFGSFRAFQEFWMSIVTFRYQDNTGYLFKVDFKTVKKIRKTFSNPGNYSGEPSHTAAQPQLAVAKIILNFHSIFPVYFYYFYVSLLFSYFDFILLFYWLFVSFAAKVLAHCRCISTITSNCFPSALYHFKFKSKQPVTTLFPPYFIPQPSPVHN